MADSSEPLLEMLWESDDAQQALETRFGFGDVVQAANWVTRTALRHLTQLDGRND